MKIFIIGGTGLVGKKLIKLLTAAGHEAVAASPSSGVNTLTGEGLADAFKGTHRRRRLQLAVIRSHSRAELFHHLSEQHRRS